MVFEDIFTKSVLTADTAEKLTLPAISFSTRDEFLKAQALTPDFLLKARVEKFYDILFKREQGGIQIGMQKIDFSDGRKFQFLSFEEIPSYGFLPVNTFLGTNKEYHSAVNSVIFDLKEKLKNGQLSEFIQNGQKSDKETGSYYSLGEKGKEYKMRLSKDFFESLARFDGDGSSISDTDLELLRYFSLNVDGALSEAGFSSFQELLDAKKFLKGELFLKLTKLLI